LKIITPADASDPAWSPIIPWLNLNPWILLLTRLMWANF
jgi:hypothetical protein